MVLAKLVFLYCPIQLCEIGFWKINPHFKKVLRKACYVVYHKNILPLTYLKIFAYICTLQCTCKYLYFLDNFCSSMYRMGTYTLKLIKERESEWLRLFYSVSLVGGTGTMARQAFGCPLEWIQHSGPLHRIWLGWPGNDWVRMNTKEDDSKLPCTTAELLCSFPNHRLTMITHQTLI